MDNLKNKNIESGKNDTLSEVATASFLPLGAHETAAIFCIPSTAGVIFFQYLSCIVAEFMIVNLIKFLKSNVICIQRTLN